MLALEAVESGEPLFDPREAGWVGLDGVAIRAQLGGDVGDLEGERPHPLGDRVERRIVARDFLEGTGAAESAALPPPSPSSPPAVACNARPPPG